MIKLPDIPFVLCEWEDAWKSAVTDTTVETSGDDHKPITCVHAGWAVRDDEKGIQLASEYSPNGTYRHLAFVPRAMVVSITPIKLTKVRQPKVKEKVTEPTSHGV